ncbi:MAG: thioredoxin family protein [Proteobacteria bacterium]|nr:thioredoxin family protein [Pseudomonadota bacterium]
MIPIQALASVGLAAVLLAACAPPPPPDAVPAHVGPRGLVTFPDAAQACGDDESHHYVTCRTQTEVLQAAMVRARREHKQVLVSVGADWCIWCYVSALYFNGWSDTRREPAAAGDRDDAIALADYMAPRFVVVNLNAEAPDLAPALEAAHIDQEQVRGYPSFFLLDAAGARFVDLDRASLPKAGDFRGYSRRGMLALLKAAQQKPPALPPSSTAAP